MTGRRLQTRVNGLLYNLPQYALDPNNPTTTGIALAPDITLMDNSFVQPQATQVSLGWTQKLASTRLYLDTEAVYVKGKDEIVVRDVNFGGNANPVRLNPAYNQINTYTNDGHSTYKALIFSLNGNWMENNLLTASLTLADKKNISDDFSPAFPFGYPNDPANIEAEWGPSRGTEDYRIVVSSIIHLPWGLIAAPIYEYGSGQPWTHRLGYDANGDGKNSDRPAGVGRNEENGPPFRQLSLRLTKAFPLSGYGNLSVIAEAFNLTDVTNYDVNSIDAAEYLSAGVENPNFGKYRATLPAREIQLGLRFEF